MSSDFPSKPEQTFGSGVSISRRGLRPSSDSSRNFTVRPGDNRGYAGVDRAGMAPPSKRTKWTINKASDAITLDEAEALEAQRAADVKRAEAEARAGLVVKPRALPKMPRNIPEKHRKVYQQALENGIPIYANDEEAEAAMREYREREPDLGIVEPKTKEPEVDEDVAELTSKYRF